MRLRTKHIVRREQAREHVADGPACFHMPACVLLQSRHTGMHSVASSRECRALADRVLGLVRVCRHGFRKKSDAGPGQSGIDLLCLTEMIEHGR